MTVRRQALSAEAATGLGAAIVVVVVVSGIEIGGRGPRPSSAGSPSRRSWRPPSPRGAGSCWSARSPAASASPPVCSRRLDTGVARRTWSAWGWRRAAPAPWRWSARSRTAGSPSWPGSPPSPSRPCCARSARRSGTLAVAGRYISATAAADIGGDLYEALDTPYGVRIIIGDVRGKGLDAVRLASIVLGSYRHVAYERADLRAIVADLDRAVARSRRRRGLRHRGAGRGARRHADHRQLWTPGAAAAAPRRGDPAGPAGAGAAAGLHAGGRRPRVERLEPGDRLLLFTDGLGEARRDGRVLPDRRAGLAAARARHGRRRAGLAGDAPWSSGCTAGWTTTSPWSCWSTPAPRPRPSRAGAELGGRRRAGG